MLNALTRTRRTKLNIFAYRQYASRVYRFLEAAGCCQIERVIYKEGFIQNGPHERLKLKD